MALIDDFFGKGQVKKNKKRAHEQNPNPNTSSGSSSTLSSSSKPKANLNLVDNPTKKPKIDPISKNNSSRCFKPKLDENLGSESILVDIDSDNDNHGNNNKDKKSNAVIKKESKATGNDNEKAASKETGKDKKKHDNTTNHQLNAIDILKTIPDADPSLLETSQDAQKLNFFQLKAKQSEVPTNIKSETSLPEGRPNCFNGLTIVFTGVLPTIDREECERISLKYGAKITKSISGKTTLVVIGKEAGPSKVKKIKQLKVKCIDEEGFIELIKRMPTDGGNGELAKKELIKKKEIEKKVEDEIISQIKSEEKDDLLSNNKISKESKLWTVKYAPTELKQICGNKGNVEMLYNWLNTWFEKKHELNGNIIDSFKAVLISGPPGTGKTTAANLISKKLGYDIVEKNASDFRSKKILNDELKVCLDNTSIFGFFENKNLRKDWETDMEKKNNKKIVLIMDEVDGMSSGDNGGVAQIAQFCKITKTPLILICNDKSLTKMRSLDKCCFDMTWRRPTSREMKSRLMTIAHRENLKLDPNLIDQLVTVTHNDIRQIINIMSTVSRTQKDLNFENLKDLQESWQKEVSLKPFDVIGKLLSSSSNKLNINEKINLYFNDMDLIPLMVHENYRATRPTLLSEYSPSKSNLGHLELLSKASDSISESDLVNQLIRSGEQQWSLLPFHAITSTIYPSSQVFGQITNRIMFTSWLGQNSKRMKFDRIVQNLQYHTCTKTNTNNIELRLSYIPFLKNKLLDPLIKNGSSGIDDVLKLMDDYYLTKEDFDNILELTVNGSRKVDDRFKKLPTNVKTAFTRKYNSYSHPTIIYKTGDSVGKGRNGRGGGGSNSMNGEGDVIDDDAAKYNESNDNDNDNEEQEEKEKEDIGKDELIKEIKKKGGTKAIKASKVTKPSRGRKK